MAGSSFRDTFSKEQTREPLLSYDTSAFLFFLASVLGTVLLPLVHYNITRPIIRRFFKKPTVPEEAGQAQCQCSRCVKDPKKKGLRIFSFGRIATLVVGVAFAVLCYKLRGKTLEISSFNPFSILEIDVSQYESADGVPRSVIRKQYRLLSLRYHPDKNNNDPAAAAHFLMINKAHQALTDPEAKKNYEMYGNPDGPTSMKVGIGLPRFLIQEEYQIGILCLFFVTLLIVIPLLMVHLYRKQVRLSLGGNTATTCRETLNFLACSLNNTKKYRFMLELVAASEEARSFGQLAKPIEQLAEYQRLAEEIPELKKKTFKIDYVTRNYYLLLAHLMRKHSLLTAEQTEVLNHLLKVSLPITQSMYELCLVREWLQAAESALELRRSLIHACDGRLNFLLQVPHVDDKIGKLIQRGRKPIKTIKDFAVAWAAATRPIEGLSESDCSDIEEFLKICPVLDAAKIRVYVEDETDMVAGDVATLDVAAARGKSVISQSAHCPFFPYNKREEWIFVALDRDTGNILQWSRQRNLQKIVASSLKFMLRKHGNQFIKVHIWNDTYFGVDLEAEHSIFVSSKTQVRRPIIVHPEDLELDNNPTFYQQIMINQVAEEGSSGAEEVFEVDTATGTMRPADPVLLLCDSNKKGS